MAAPINRIVVAARGAALKCANPAMVLNPFILLGKHVKPKLSGPDLARAQLEAWDKGMAAHARQKSKSRRR
jgi:hypothetical protein